MTDKALTYVELELRTCGLTYGVWPCQAALGVTGDHKCFNTRATCQDRANFDTAPESLGEPEYVTTLSDTSPSGATVTFSDVAVAADGSIALTVSAHREAGDNAISSATIDGQSATVLSQVGSGGSRSAVLWAEGPFGDEVDIAITFANTCDWVKAGVWRTGSGRPVDGSGATNTTVLNSSVSLDVKQNDSVLAAVTSYLQSSTSWTGLDEADDDADGDGNYSFAGGRIPADDDAYAVTAAQAPAVRAAPTVVSNAAASTGSNSMTATLGGFQVGDIVIHAIETSEGTSVTADNATLIDYANTNITDGADGSSRLTLFWARYSSTSHTCTFTSSVTDHIHRRSIIIRGANPNGSPIGQIAKAPRATATANSLAIPAVTTTVANSLVLDFLGRGDDSSAAIIDEWSNGTLASQSQIGDGGTTTGNGGGIAVQSGVMASPGDTGETTADLVRAVYPVGVKIAVIPTDYSDGEAALAAAAFRWEPSVANTHATLRFAKPADYRPQDIEAIASISDVSVTPARIRPGEDLGSRATVRVTFKDHPHPDTGPGLDPYHAERDYDPYRRGSFWSKFRARQPYLKGERLTLRQGFVGQTLEEMETSLFIVESFDGPTVDGTYTLIAHDPLKMLDGDRAQCPRVNRGRLLLDLGAGETSFSITPSGLGDAEYAESGWLNLGGKEMVEFTRSGDDFTITRGQMGTVAVEHKAGDRVQQAARFDSMDPADIIHELMTVYAGVPEDWIPLGDWQAETGGYLQRVFDITVAEPTAVAKLVGELMQDAGLSVWWDEIGQKIRLRVLRPISTDVATHDESLMKRGSLAMREQPDKRFSEVWIHFGQVSPLGGEDVDNYPLVSVTADLEAQDNYQSPKIKKVYSRGIGRGGRTVADRVGSIVLSRYRNPPRLFTYALQRGAQPDPILGDGYKVSHRILQDATGARQPVGVQIVSLGRGPVDFTVTAEEFNYELPGDLGDRQVTINANMFAANFRTMHDDLYPAPNPGDTVTCIIEQQVIVGGAPGQPAFNVGNWPTQAATGARTSGSAVITGLSIDATELLAEGILVSGTGIPAGTRIASIDSASQVTLTANATSGSGTSTTLTFYLVNLVIENRGIIAGMGGAGGTGRSANGGDPPSSQRNGQPGGTGLYSRYPFTYRDDGATTQGGGGGGAGGSCANLDNHRGGGGGGGAGAPGGAAGIGPGNGEDGQPGTLTEGGAYGRSYTSSTFWSAPSLKPNVHGGAGGAPGTAGDNDVGNYDLGGGSPGAAGAAIDGISFVIQDGPAGTRHGAQTN